MWDGYGGIQAIFASWQCACAGALGRQFGQVTFKLPARTAPTHSALRAPVRHVCDVCVREP